MKSLIHDPKEPEKTMSAYIGGFRPGNNENQREGFRKRIFRKYYWEWEFMIQNNLRGK